MKREKERIERGEKNNSFGGPNVGTIQISSLSEGGDSKGTMAGDLPRLLHRFHTLISTISTIFSEVC